MKTLKDVDVRGKRVLVRVDFNVPLKEGEVADDTRIRAALPTIKHLLEQGAKVILMSHLGRPKGIQGSLRLDVIAKRLSKLLSKPLIKLDECVGPKVNEAVRKLSEGEICLLENLRFYPGEKKNDPEFAKQLASLAEIYINDAFATAHRSHASTVGVAEYLPAVGGLLLEKEVKFLGHLLKSPQKPFVAILGGAKISDKIGVIRNLLPKVDSFLIGGGLANAFLAAKGFGVGKSLLEGVEVAEDLLGRGEEKFSLPLDVVVASSPEAGASFKVVSVDCVPEGWHITDIGPKTIKKFTKDLSKARTVMWNGPLGIFEVAEFSKGTVEIARALADLDATVIVGGGETAAAVQQAGLSNQMTWVSTGGGASLKFLEGSELAAIEALR
jgi:phosphoglycerate kinase